MKTILLAFVLAFVAAQEQGNPGHKEPAPGWFCSHAAKDEHHCECQRVDHDPACEGPPIEHSACKVFCWPRSCKCPVMCHPEEKG